MYSIKSSTTRRINGLLCLIPLIGLVIFIGFAVQQNVPTSEYDPYNTTTYTSSLPTTTTPTTTTTASCSIKSLKSATVTYIVDGDTLDISSTRIRLADIDTPESGESGYQSAKNYISQKVNGKKIYYDSDGYDKYGRLVAVIYVETSTNTFMNVNKALWQYGYAELWDYTNKFSPYSWTLYVSC